MANIDSMQLIASSPTTQMYWDFSDTQAFYLYNRTTKQLTHLSFSAAKSAFEQGSFSWTLPGSNFFGVSAQNNLGNWYPQLNFPSS